MTVSNDHPYPFHHGTHDDVCPSIVAVVLCGTAGGRMYPFAVEPLPGDDDVDDPNGKLSYLPKHVLTVGGVPIIRRLMASLSRAGFERCVIACAASDGGITRQTLLSDGDDHNGNKVTVGVGVCIASKDQPDILQCGPRLQVALTDLPSSCEGSWDALRAVVTSSSLSSFLRPENDHLMVLPSDLVLFDDDVNVNVNVNGDIGDDHGHYDDRVFGPLADTHRKAYETNAAVTVLLADVGDVDDSDGGGTMALLKESARMKKGGIPREGEEVEYMALQRPIDSIYTMSKQGTSPSPHRLVLKRSKVDVEDDVEETGETPRLTVPKYILDGIVEQDVNGYSTKTMCTVRVTTNLMDLHVYVFAPWVVQDLISLPSNNNTTTSLQQELLPLLIAGQFRDPKWVVSSLTSSSSSPSRGLRDGDVVSDDVDDDGNRPGAMEDFLFRCSAELLRPANNDNNDNEAPTRSRQNRRNFHCAAHILPPPTAAATTVPTDHKTRSDAPRRKVLACRSSTVASYSYCGREAVSCLMEKPTSPSPSSSPSRNQYNLVAKFHTLHLPGSVLGEKVRMQHTTVGQNCKIGSKSKLNHVVIMEGTTVGENCILQNSVVGQGVDIGNNCSLNDCQVGHGVTIPPGTKVKGEVLTVDSS